MVEMHVYCPNCKSSPLEFTAARTAQVLTLDGLKEFTIEQKLVCRRCDLFTTNGTDWKKIKEAEKSK